MRLGKDFYDKIKENELYRMAYDCLHCGSCASIWPLEHRCSLSAMYQSNEANAQGLNRIMQEILEDKLMFSEGLVDFIFRCTTCDLCRVNCPGHLRPRDYIESLRKDLVEEGEVPKIVMEVFESALKYGNVWGKPKDQRSKWAEGLKIKTVSEAEDFEYLLFVGDSSSYVDRNQETAKKFVNILNKAGVKFAYLGNEERSSGNEILRMGEEGLFESLAEENIANFKKYGVKKIIALSPHSFHALKNEYPKLDPDLNIEVLHYTQCLNALIKQGKIKLKKKVNKKVTYQDPCYLAKHNSIYEEPREILHAIPGLELIEMEFIKEKGVCCGGGGGGVWIERGDGTKVEDFRFNEAIDLNVDAIATACPFCTQMLEAAKEEYGDSNIEIKDIIELVYEAQF